MTRAVLLAAIGAYSAIGAPATAVNIAWLPVTDAERQMSAPIVEKSAGVEALFWRVHVLDEIQGQDLQRVLYHYVRLKIFNQDGKEKVATIDLRYGDKTSIAYVSGRTIKADGSIVELTKDAVHDRVLTRMGGIKESVKSFAMPGVEVGSIVEYRWKETRNDPHVMYLRLQLQREYPVQKVTYFVKPIPQEDTTYKMGVWPFNCTPSPLVLGQDGFNSTSLENVPAFREEPMMPGEGSVRPWVLIYYHNDGKREPDKYWSGIGKHAYSELKQAMKSSGELKSEAAEAVESAKNDDEKVMRLIRYIRANLRSFYDRGVTGAERAAIIKKLEKGRYRTSKEIIKSGIATPDEMNTVFASLAAEVGLDARPVMVPSRSDFLFDERLTERYFLESIDMAVTIGNKWKLYDVSANLLPPGMLTWQEEAEQALLADPKKPVFIPTPIAPPEDSLSSRTAKLSLSEDGTLEGDIQESWTGHSAFDRRVDLHSESDARQAERIKDEIVKDYPQAEVDDLKIENADKAEQPLKLRYHIRIPGYGQRTGKRLFFQPLFFQKNATPVFSAADRKYDIHFHYGWRERDEIAVELPPDFELEKAENPGGLSLGKTGFYDLTMALRDGKELVCTRELIFGKDGQLFFPRQAYGQVKNAFDSINQRDSHMLALRQKSGTQ
jgi:hypothetical protein